MNGLKVEATMIWFTTLVVEIDECEEAMLVANSRNSKLSISSEHRNLKGAKRERLIAERKRLGLTQTQLAEKLGCSTATISHLELGRMKPGLEISLGLETIFKQSYETLFPDL